MSKPLLALWSLTSKTSNPLHAVWSLTSKEWLNPWLHIVELISIKRYLNRCLHCGAFYYEFFACLLSTKRSSISHSLFLQRIFG
jgi:hypothetical protein